MIKINRGGNRAAFTVRKISYGVGVERIFPLHSPRIDRVASPVEEQGPSREAVLPAWTFRQSRPPRYHGLFPVDSALRGGVEDCRALGGHLHVAAEVRAFAHRKIFRGNVAVDPRV